MAQAAPAPVLAPWPEVWNWGQAIVWAMYRDEELVALCDQDRRRFAERHAERVRAGLRPAGSEQDLRTLLRAGRITTRGQRGGDDAVENIPGMAWPEWAGMPSGWSEDEITFDAGEVRRELPYIPEAARPMELSQDPNWVVQKMERGRRRVSQLRRFRNCQHRRRRWLSFEEIADWCSREPGTIRRDETLRAQAYADLRDAMFAGEFGRGAHSLVLYFHFDPDALQGRLRLAPEGLTTWLDFYGADSPLITTEVLSRCWLPRHLSRSWFERRGLTWPTVFDPPDAPVARQATMAETIPVLSPGPKGGEPKAAAIAWEIAEQILADDRRRPRPGRGRLTALARAVQPLLKARRHNREIDTITKDIRRSFREWEAKSPGK
jgi:hypothetical protein